MGLVGEMGCGGCIEEFIAGNLQTAKQSSSSTVAVQSFPQPKNNK